MELAVSGNSVYLSPLHQLWRFESLLQSGEDYHEHDQLYLLQMSWITGDLDVHDLSLCNDGELVFVS